MGLNPGESKAAENLRKKILDDQFNGGSPYYGMYHCGYYGVPIEDCIAKCQANGIAIRPKDIRSYNDGVFKRGIGEVVRDGVKVNVVNMQPGIQFENMRLQDFPMFPAGWTGTERRFFPCTQDNRPMQKWGWSKGYTPELRLKSDAKALSPCGWVGQNMLYQRFIVLDIDGRGHGADDLEVIAFGSQFRNQTFTMEDPAKPGSFHLYFETDRLIPVRHFPWAKLDLMGNAVNAAVYLKNKVGNGLPMMRLDESIWQAMMDYQIRRKEKQCF
jgi:hypothetical protein